MQTPAVGPDQGIFSLNPIRGQGTFQEGRLNFPRDNFGNLFMIPASCVSPCINLLLFPREFAGIASGRSIRRGKRPSRYHIAAVTHDALGNKHAGPTNLAETRKSRPGACEMGDTRAIPRSAARPPLGTHLYSLVRTAPDCCAIQVQTDQDQAKHLHSGSRWGHSNAYAEQLHKLPLALHCYTLSDMRRSSNVYLELSSSLACLKRSPVWSAAED
ncbi:hypothetical protein BKA67DRAFT_531900 [Truncatella angustata]|uniref:Uncharacterized protein n=1 Tax=Truncatella angustata TaxID=152316 RepID=A0A9P8UQR5_9PEZI|nr:uncharacterized protein BKA67DRAFT_531900 [Truncatella angustata]KAH6656639.1 hypothetical protein BKA67DRAFT_531900 [Truncatella angustata]